MIDFKDREVWSFDEPTSITVTDKGRNFSLKIETEKDIAIHRVDYLETIGKTRYFFYPKQQITYGISDTEFIVVPKYDKRIYTYKLK